MNNGDQTNKPSEMNPEELPDERAFKDEFTRGFLQSTEETRPGYYPFLSGTGKYGMDFPAEGIMGEREYAKEKQRFEAFLIYIGSNESTINSLIKINYYSFTNNENENLEKIESSIGKDLVFEEISMEDHTIYLAPYDYDDGIFGYAASIINEKKNGEVRIFYDTECTSDIGTCSEIKDSEKEKIINWIKLIEFVEK